MKIGIIGGGASGMVAAISAAVQGADVTILEGGDRIGRKILATGNGKCNFTNLKMDSSCFRSNTIEDIAPFLDEFDVADTLQFFKSLKMLYKDKNGYCYPISEQASTVLDVLRFQIEALGIRVLTDTKARLLTYQKDGTVKVLSGTESYVFDRVILACGSKAAPKTGSDGSGYQLLRSLKCDCRIEEVVPALVQLCCKEDYLKSVAGVRIEGKVHLFIDGQKVCEETGEIQLTEYGISGIPVFQISRFASYGCLAGRKVQVQLDVMPHMEAAEFQAYMEERRAVLCNTVVKWEGNVLYKGTLEQLQVGLINKKVCLLFGKMAGISPGQLISQVPKENFNHFVSLFKTWTLTVDKPKGFDMAQACAGGLSMAEINAHFAMKKSPSVYVAGELLDVDGMCGGYNLQWAWTSGYLAGKYAVLDYKGNR